MVGKVSYRGYQLGEVIGEGLFALNHHVAVETIRKVRLREVCTKADRHEHSQASANVPAHKQSVVKDVALDVLHANDFRDALGNETFPNAAQKRCVEEA
jgi:hypothetical protein